MKWSMLWDLSVHNMSLPFDHTCCLSESELETYLCFLASENCNRKPLLKSSFLFLLPPTVQFDFVPRRLDLRHKRHTNSCRQHVLNLQVVVSLGISASEGSSSSSFPTSTSARDSPTGSMSSPIGATSRLKVFVGLTSALLCHHRFPIADNSS